MSAPLIQFYDAIATLSQIASLPMGLVAALVDGTLEGDLRNKKKHRTLARKQQLDVEVKNIINQLEGEGWNLAFTDGSAKHHPKSVR